MALPDLSGKVVVITGASRGIGAGLAEVCAARGMRLGLCARSSAALPPSGEVLVHRLDVGDESAMEAFGAAVLERYGRIDLWVNNAGILSPVIPVRELSGEALAAHLRTNLIGVLHGTRIFVRHLRARGAGSEDEGVLLNISSGAAWNGLAGWAAYCAGKAGVERLTETVQLEEAEHGLRAHAVAPGIVDTAMQERIRASSPEVFPEVERFRKLQEDRAFNSMEFVVDHLLALAFDPAARTREVLVRLPMESSP